MYCFFWGEKGLVLNTFKRMYKKKIIKAPNIKINGGFNIARCKALIYKTPEKIPKLNFFKIRKIFVFHLKS